MLVLDIWWFDTESSTGKISTSNILHANICSKNRIINISINEMQQKIVPPSKFVDLKTSFLTWQCDAEQVGVPVWKYSPFSICGISMVSNWCILKEPTLINIRVEYDLCLDVKDMKRIMTFHVAKSCLLLISLSVLLEELSSNNDTFYVVSELDGFRWSVRNHRQL